MLLVGASDAHRRGICSLEAILSLRIDLSIARRIARLDKPAEIGRSHGELSECDERACRETKSKETRKDELGI